MNSENLKESIKQEKYFDLSSAPGKSDLFSQTTIFRIFLSKKKKILLLFSNQIKNSMSGNFF